MQPKQKNKPVSLRRVRGAIKSAKYLKSRYLKSKKLNKIRSTGCAYDIDYPNSKLCSVYSDVLNFGSCDFVFTPVDNAMYK